MQTTQRTLSEHAPDPEAYAAKYAELKGKNVRELDRFLMVAAKILTGARFGPTARRAAQPRSCAPRPRAARPLVRCALRRCRPLRRRDAVQACVCAAAPALTRAAFARCRWGPQTRT